MSMEQTVFDLINRHWSDLHPTTQRPDSLIFLKIAGKTSPNAAIIAMILDNQFHRPVAVAKIPRNPKITDGLENEYAAMIDIRESVSDPFLLKHIPWRGKLIEADGIKILLQEAGTGHPMVREMTSRECVETLYARILPWMFDFHAAGAEEYVLEGEVLHELIEAPIDRFIEQFGSISSKILSSETRQYLSNLAKKVEGRTVRLCRQHGDFNAYNILVELHNRQISHFTLIDWEDYRTRQLPIYDLNHFFIVNLSVIQGLMKSKKQSTGFLMEEGWYQDLYLKAMQDYSTCGLIEEDVFQQLVPLYLSQECLRASSRHREQQWTAPIWIKRIELIVKLLKEKKNMNILFVFHFCSAEINDIAAVPIWLGKQGNRVLVITAQYENSLKGVAIAPREEEIGGTKFYRPFQNHKNLRKWHGEHWREIREEVAEFSPDVIIQFGEFNFRLPMILAREFNVPLVLFVEYLRLNKFALPFRGKGLIQKALPAIDRWMTKIFRQWLIQRYSAVMFSYFGDCHLIPVIERHCPIVRYVPWCTETDEQPEEVDRNRKTGIYIGSLEGFKNTAELVEAIPLILEHTATERFVVIGPGEFAPKIKALAGRYGPRLEYIESVPRKTAMRLLRSSGYGYTPVADCGLGFIGDCWGTGTPLITTHDLDGFLNKDIDTLIADNVSELPKTINSLLGSDTLFEVMQRGGMARYLTNFTAKAVGEKHLEVLKNVLENTKK